MTFPINMNISVIVYIHLNEMTVPDFFFLNELKVITFGTSSVKLKHHKIQV